MGPLITFAALPLAVFYHSRLAALWLVTLAFLVPFLIPLHHPWSCRAVPDWSCSSRSQSVPAHEAARVKLC